MRRTARFALLVVPLVARLVVAPTPSAHAAEIPPLTERELGTFIAVEKALVADAGRSGEFCSVDFAETADDGGATAADPDGTRIGAQLEAHPYFGPLLRRHSIGGRRFAQIAAQVVGNALGLAMVDSLDESAREKGQPATNRASFLERSPDARLVAAKLDEITAVLRQYQELCEGASGGDDEESVSDDAESGR